MTRSIEALIRRDRALDRKFPTIAFRTSGQMRTVIERAARAADLTISAFCRAAVESAVARNGSENMPLARDVFQSAGNGAHGIALWGRPVIPARITMAGGRPAPPTPVVTAPEASPVSPAPVQHAPVPPRPTSQRPKTSGWFADR